MTDAFEGATVRKVRVERTLRIVNTISLDCYVQLDGKQMTEQEIREYEVDRLADPDMIGEVIQDIYENAPFSNPGPEITTRVEFVDVGVSEDVADETA